MSKVKLKDFIDSLKINANEKCLIYKGNQIIKKITNNDLIKCIEYNNAIKCYIIHVSESRKEKQKLNCIKTI